jgi:hypothetical protein
LLCHVDWGNGKTCTRTDRECTSWHYGVETASTSKETAADAAAAGAKGIPSVFITFLNIIYLTSKFFNRRRYRF